MIRKFFCFAFLLIAFSAGAQEGQELFKTAFAKMKEASTYATKGLSLKYNVTVLTAAGQQYSDNIALEMKDKRFKVISSDVSVFQDEKTMVVIQPAQKVIFMTKPTPAMGNNQWQNLIALQDSLVANLIVKSCVDVVDLKIAKGPCKKIDLMLPMRIQQNMGVTSVTYWIEEREATIRKVQIVYAKRSEQPLSRLDFEFREMNFNYRATPFAGTALSLVMENRSNMKASYKDFKVIDKRQ